MGSVPDGVFDFVDGAIRVLAAPQISIERLRRLATLLRTAQREQESPDALAQKLEEELPELRSLRDILPTNRSELYKFSSLLLVLLGLIITSGNCGKTPSENEARRISEEAVQQSIGLTDADLDQAERNICVVPEQPGRKK